MSIDEMLAWMRLRWRPYVPSHLYARAEYCVAQHGAIERATLDAIRACFGLGPSRACDALEQKRR
jgi:hypothetical protein